MTTPRLALAVSGHGFGHAVRCAEVARELLRRRVAVLVRSDAPHWLFPPEVEWISSPGWALDVGVIQRDGLELDIDATRDCWRQFACEFDARAEAEARLLADRGVQLLVGDIPPLAFAAAERAGVRSLGLTNFTWDWIYSAWPDFHEIVACVRDVYARANGLLRLPLHGDCGAFGNIEDVPLIARHAQRTRAEVRSELGVSDTATLVLLSFGGFTAHGLNLARLGELKQFKFVMAPPLCMDEPPANVMALNESPGDYVSLLAACDVVITKPGYGIVADCLANRVSVLFTDRGPFREYEVLVEGLGRLGRARYVPRADLLDMDLRTHLEAILDCKAVWSDLATNGAAVVAERMVQTASI